MLAAVPLIFLSILIRPALSFLRSPAPSSLTLSKGERHLVKSSLPTSSDRNSNIYQLARTNHAAIVANETLLLLGGEPSTSVPTHSTAHFNTLIAWNQPSKNTRGGQWWIPKKFSSPGTLSVPLLPPQPFATKALLTDYGVALYAPTPTHASSTKGTNQPLPPSSLALLDLKTWKWSYPDTRGHWPTKCVGPSLAARKDTLYMLGGLPLTGDNKPDTTRPILNEFTSLNMKTMTWSTLPPAKSLVQHTMCYNPVMDALIAFGGKTEVEIGSGGQGGRNRSKTKEWPVVDWLMVFDLKTDTWNMNLTSLVSGGGPGRRKRHTATCLPNGQMIVYGGSSTTNTVKVTDEHDTTYDADTDVWVLNVTRSKESDNIVSNRKKSNAWNWRFVWWKPAITNTADAPGPRMGHTSSLVGNNMVLYGGTSARKSKTDISSFYNLDTRLWRWSKLIQPVSSNQVLATAAPSKAPTDAQESGMNQASETGPTEFQIPEGEAVPPEGIQISTPASAPQPWLYVASVGGGLIFSFTAGICFWTRYLKRKKKISASEDDEPKPERQGHDDSENTAFMTVRENGEEGDCRLESPTKRNVDGTVVNVGTELGKEWEASTRPRSVHSQINTDRRPADLDEHFQVAIDDIVVPAERSKIQRSEKWSARVLKKLRSSFSSHPGDTPPPHSTYQSPNVKQLVRTFDSMANKTNNLEEHPSMKIESSSINEIPMRRNTASFSDMEVNNDRYQSSMPILGGLLAILRGEVPVPYNPDERDISCRRRTSLASLSSFEYLAKCGYLSPTLQTSPSSFGDLSGNTDDSDDGIDTDSFSTVGRLSKLPAAFYIAKLMADIKRDTETTSAKLNAKQEPAVNRSSGHDGSFKTFLAENENKPLGVRENVKGIQNKRESRDREEGANFLVRSERVSKDETINSSFSYHTSPEVWSIDADLAREQMTETVPIDGSPTRSARTIRVATPISPLNTSSPSSSPMKLSHAPAQLESPTSCDRISGRPDIPKIIISSNLPRLDSSRTISTLATLVDGTEGYCNQTGKSTLCAEEELESGKNTSEGPTVHWDENLMKIQFNAASAELAKVKFLNAEATKLTMVSASEVPQPVNTAIRRWSFLRALRRSRAFSIKHVQQTPKHNVDYSPDSPSVPLENTAIFSPIATVSAAALMTSRNQIIDSDPGRIAFVSRSLAADVLSEPHSPLDRLAKMKWASRAHPCQRHRHRRTEAGNESFRAGQVMHLTPDDPKIRYSSNVSTLNARGSRVESQDMSYHEWSIGEGEVSSIFGKTNLLRKEIGELGLAVTAV